MDLRGEVRGHRVDVLGQVFPDAGHLAHLRLTAELAFGADLARHARHLRGEHAELLDHGVDDAGRAQKLALQRPAVDLEAHSLQQITLRDGADGASHFRGRPKQIVDEGVDRGLHLAPRPMREVELHPLARLSFATHDLTDALELLRHAFVGSHDLVEGVGDFAQEADLIAGHADREVAHAHGLQRIQEIVQLGRCAAIDAAIGHFSRHRARRWTIGLEFANRLIVRLHSLLRRG